MTQETYGLELTNNSKVGWAFSISRMETCVNATNICKKLCYGNGIRYGSKNQIEKRKRNFRTAQFLLQHGGPERLAENLVLLTDVARPRDWLTAKISGAPTSSPWTVRIHDVGDFFSQQYTEAWTIAVKQRPDCRFWFYTRSFSSPLLLKLLTQLAALPNCQGWLSADEENYSQAISAYNQAPAIWKIALLQDQSLSEHIPTALKQTVPAERLINFPYHHGRYHAEPLKCIRTCPAVLGTYKLNTNPHTPRPCQQCKICLP